MAENCGIAFPQVAVAIAVRQPARLWDHTLCAMVNDLRVYERLTPSTRRPHTSGDLRKRVTATYWGSSGRRFKSCRPDQDRRRSERYFTAAASAETLPVGGMDSNAVHKPGFPAPAAAAHKRHRPPSAWHNGVDGVYIQDCGSAL